MVWSIDKLELTRPAQYKRFSLIIGKKGNSHDQGSSEYQEQTPGAQREQREGDKCTWMFLSFFLGLRGTHPKQNVIG